MLSEREVARGAELQIPNRNGNNKQTKPKKKGNKNSIGLPEM